jgi:uncharacterized protein
VAGEIAEIAQVMLSAAAVVGIVAFFSLWVHRAEGNRALTMGLYIVFGAFGFFVFLYGAGSAYRSYLEGESISKSSILAILLGVIAALGILPPLRHLISKIIPFNPRSKPDWVGFIVLSQIAALSIVSLTEENGSVEPVSLPYLIIQGTAFVAIAFLLVGALIYRTPSDAMVRLGLVRPTGRQVGAAFGLVIALFAVSVVASLLVQEFQPELHEEINENLVRLTEDVDSAPGALVLGLTSGTGEEVLMRGAIQPRFGILFTSALFAVLHAQYGLSYITAGVFVSGLVLGLERKYLNTTCCIITHATYNTIAVAATLVITVS